MNLNLRQIEAFVALARLGGFSRAASQMHITQAGLSILIRKLEERIGAPLFERTTRSVTLTSTGDSALPIAERILTDAQALVSSARVLAGNHSGRISLGLTPLLAETVLPEVLKQFRQAYPRLSVRFRECANDDILGRIYSRELEFGLAFGIPKSNEFDSVPVLQETLALACPIDHPLAARRRVYWSDLENQPLITLTLGSTLRTLTENALVQIGATVSFAYEASNVLTALALAREGLGMAIVHSSVGMLGQTTGTVLKMLYRPVVKRSLDLITRRGSVLSPSAQAFVEYVVAAMNARKPA